jgi:hypothetical protein
VLPDGTSSTTSLLAANSTAVDNRDILRNPGPAATGNTTYTVSAFVKSSAGSNAYIQVNGDGACVGYYNLTAGTAVVGQDLGVGATNKSVAITPLVNGWFRISMTFTSGPATTSLLFFIGLCSIVSTSGDNRTTAGVIGQGLYVWGTQIEQGSLSSHIATVGAAVTRAFDNCFIASADMAPWFASSGGTWFAEFIDNTPLGATSPRVIGIHGASGVAPLWANNSGFFISSGGGDINTINTVVPGAVSKGVSTQGGGAGKICLNGGGIGTGAQTGFATLATTGTGILGANPGVVNETMTGYIRRVQYWPRVLSDAEMQQVTT